MKVLIYAVGGGHGHATRGSELARRLRAEGCECRVLVREGSDRYLALDSSRSYEPWSSIACNEFDVLVVDTFPRGWRREITESDISRFSKSIFIARFNRCLDRADLEIFDEIWDPAPLGKSEWDDLERAKPVGWLVDDSKFDYSEEPMTFWLVDPDDRSGEIGNRLVERAGELGWSAKRVRRLPKVLTAERFLFVGAGYNTFYETRPVHSSSRFIPLKKKYDDQLRRAGALALVDLREFDRWLGQSSVSSGSSASSGKTS